MECEASFKLDERSEVKKSCKLLVHKNDSLVQHVAQMVQIGVRHYVCETVITTSSELYIGIQVQILSINNLFIHRTSVKFVLCIPCLIPYVKLINMSKYKVRG